MKALEGSTESRPTEARPTNPIGIEALGARFGRGSRFGAALMRQMRHVRMGRELFTTEEWLAEWLAAKSVPQTNWPKANLDPLEEAVCSRVIQLIGDLARRGVIEVKAV